MRHREDAANFCPWLPVKIICEICPWGSSDRRKWGGMNCHHHLCCTQLHVPSTAVPGGCHHSQVPLSYQSCLLIKTGGRNSFLGMDICPRPGCHQPANKNSSGRWRQDKRETFIRSVAFRAPAACISFRAAALHLCKVQVLPAVPEAGFAPKDV